MNRSLPTFKEAQEHVKISHFTKKGYDIRGVMHVGTNDWYELQWYLKMGIDYNLGFEPLKSAYDAALERYEFILTKSNRGKNKLFNIGLSSRTGKDLLHVASGDGQSSSIYKLVPERLATHGNEAPIRDETIEVQSFRNFLRTRDDIRVNMDVYNCLVIDVEGMELSVLKGMGPYLEDFQFLNIELSGVPRFDGGPTAEQVIKFLKENGFVQDSPVEDCNDVMFIRKDLV